MSPRFRACLSIAFLLVAQIAPAAGVREIESPAGADSLAPSVAALDDGRLVLTWLEPVGGGHALKFSVLDGDGFGTAGTIARGEGWFVNWADTPRLFALPGGDWLAHWLVKSGPATYAYDIRMARSSDGGQSWSEPMSPHHDGTQTEHGFASYFPESANDAGMVWLDGRRMAAHAAGEGAMTLRTAVVSSGGAVSDRVVLDERVCDCCQTASALTAEGPVVVYRDRTADEIRDHYVVRRTRAGWTEPQRLHADNWRIGGCPVNGPAVVADGERAATAWFTMPEGDPRVNLAVSDDSGRSFALVDSLGRGTAVGRVDLAANDRGFVLSLIDREDRSGVLALAGYDWSGRRLWLERIESLDAGRASGFPRLGLLQGCRPVVAWTGRQGEARRVRVVEVVRPDACDAESGLDRPGVNP